MGMFCSSDHTLLFRLLHSFKPDLQLAASEHSRVLGMDSITPDAPGSSGPATPPQHVQAGPSGADMLDTQARLQVRSLRTWCLVQAFLYGLCQPSLPCTCRHSPHPQASESSISLPASTIRGCSVHICCSHTVPSSCRLQLKVTRNQRSGVLQVKPLLQSLS